jgi:WD40 repeat protein
MDGDTTNRIEEGRATMPSDPRTRPTFEQFTAIRRYQHALALSPDGAEIAYSVNTSGQYNLWRQSSAGGFPNQVTLSGSQAVREIEWSPDGETILYTADNDGDEFTRVYRIPVQGGHPEEFAGQEEVRYFLSGGFPTPATNVSRPIRTCCSGTLAPAGRSALPTTGASTTRPTGHPMATVCLSSTSNPTPTWISSCSISRPRR